MANDDRPAQRLRTPKHATDSRQDDAMLQRFVRTRDPRLREQLVERFMPLAHSLAWRYASRGEPIEDLVQVASEGLVRAVDGYDADRGVRFSSYATPTILGALRHYFRDSTHPVRVPRGLGERIQAVRAAADRAGADLADSGAVPVLAKLSSLSPSEVREAIEADRSRRMVSLNGLVRGAEDGESPALIDSLGAEDREFELVDSSVAASRAELDGRESAVLALRFGQSMTQREVGDEIGVSQMQVSRVQRSALTKLLEAVREPDLPVQLSAAG